MTTTTYTTAELKALVADLRNHAERCDQLSYVMLENSNEALRCMQSETDGERLRNLSTEAYCDYMESQRLRVESREATGKANQLQLELDYRRATAA